MRISGWSSDVCSSDLRAISSARVLFTAFRRRSGSNCVRISQLEGKRVALWGWGREGRAAYRALRARDDQPATVGKRPGFGNGDSEGLAAGELTLFCSPGERSEEHTSELQSLMRISYAVFCLKK